MNMLLFIVLPITGFGSYYYTFKDWLGDVFG